MELNNRLREMVRGFEIENIKYFVLIGLVLMVSVFIVGLSINFIIGTYDSKTYVPATSAIGTVLLVLVTYLVGAQKGRHDAKNRAEINSLRRALLQEIDAKYDLEDYLRSFDSIKPMAINSLFRTEIFDSNKERIMDLEPQEIQYVLKYYRRVKNLETKLYEHMNAQGFDVDSHEVMELIEKVNRVRSKTVEVLEEGITLRERAPNDDVTNGQ